MGKVIGVFICGTHADLIQERSSVLTALRKAQFQQLSMEFFGARPDQPIETCLAEVRRSDVIIVIVAHKYGSVVPNMGISFSEAEYSEAFKLGKPCLVYLKDENVPVLPAHFENDPEKMVALQVFKDTLKQRHTPAYFTDANDLANTVIIDLFRTVFFSEKAAIDLSHTASNPVYRGKDELEKEIKHPQEQSKVYKNPVLVFQSDGNVLLVDSLRIESNKTLKLSLLPENAKDSALIAKLEKAQETPLIVAYGMTAMLAKVVSVSHMLEAGHEVWNVELRSVTNEYTSGGALGEMAFNNYSPDQIAEMRAKRILLDKDDQLDIMLEVFVRGSGPITVKASPFPSLYAIAKNNITEFLAFARLYAVAWLILSGTVEFIHILELQMEGEAKLGIKFEGQRARRFTNVAPHIIQVEGVCNLEHKYAG
ncbi:MAG TPA: DUF4062 domain-containing protein [Blastocatellia bacterium]|nr:DUF4062 domain-containing protein [Blastocatellia bacterium]